jgi:uncharacterized protein (DUF302 family)
MPSRILSIFSSVLLSSSLASMLIVASTSNVIAQPAAGSAAPAAPSAAATSPNGITALPSRFSVAETIDRVEKTAKARGITVFARVDHSGEADKAGLKLRPTQLLILGNPKAGTPVMAASQSAAIDLPLKVLAWEDASGKVWVGFNSGAYLKERHQIPDDLVKNVAAIGGIVAAALE